MNRPSSDLACAVTPGALRRRGPARVKTRTKDPVIGRSPAERATPCPGPARQDRSARSCHGPLAGPIPAKREAARGHRGQLAAALRAEPSGQRPASKAHDRARPAGYPADTCHRPPVDLRRQRGAGQPQRPSGASDSADERAHSPRRAWLSLHWAISGCGDPLRREDRASRSIPGSCRASPIQVGAQTRVVRPPPRQVLR